MSTIPNPVQSNFTPLTNVFCAYTDLTSVVQGGTIKFYVSIPVTISQRFQIDIYRQEEGLVGPVDTITGEASQQTDSNNDPDVNGCGWQVSLEYNIPNDTQHKSGAYIAKLTSAGQYDFYTAFFVKAANPGVNGKILFVGSVSTWQAYNVYKNKNLYGDTSGNFENRARKVSFNRPLQMDTYPQDQAGPWWYIKWERQFIQWFYKAKTNSHLPSDMEMEFCSSVDLHADPTIVNNYKLVISIGHDEYWSWEMRDTIQDFISAGGNVAFFSGNVSWWQVRFETDQIDNPDRIMVCYKDAEEDPETNPQRKTINWFEPSINRPENLMTGLSYYWGTALWSTFSANYRVSLQRHWLLKDTGLADRQTFGSGLFTEFETDAADFVDIDRKFPIPTGKLAYETTEFTAPKDFMILASANLTGLGELPGTYDGPSNHNGWATMGIFRKRNGGFVFHGSNYNWARDGLNPYVLYNDWNEFCWITKNILDVLGNDFEAQAFLIVNPGFEYLNQSGQLLEWYKTGGGTAIRSTPGYEGDYCAFVDGTSGGETILHQQYIPIRTSRSYKVSCFAKPGSPLDGPGGGTAISIRLETLDVNNKPIQEFVVASYPTGNDTWLEISAQGSISTTENEDFMVQARVKVQVKSGYSAYFDSVVVEEL